ncbi:Smr/MutS family protein [Jeongeupia naejangsanensis]|uniref:Smr/MutS family protein n=2 Tax=Jeongeupia naejangsanensis TaxID=613195 RepID=A0ABS2BF56_9NEIS|nr:Smr/MutS family protein [Jeongeupia naejangsanensis]
MDSQTRRRLQQFKQSLSARAQPAPVRTPSPPPPDDHTLFMNAVRGSTPLRQDKRHPHPSAPPSPWPQRQHADLAPHTEAMSDFWPWDELAAGEELLYLRPGQKLDTLKKLRRGHWLVQAELDLHGYASEAARQQVAEFLHAAQQARRRCVRIIHGKGLSSKNAEPVLKLKLRNWLVQRDEVLAFSQARPADGGSGAVLVLLKSKRNP